MKYIGTSQLALNREQEREISYTVPTVPYSSRLLTDLTKGEEINAGDYLSLEVF